MVRILNSKWHTEEKLYIYAVGLSGDVKPTEGIVAGSVFLEADTGLVFRFDEENGRWYNADSGVDVTGFVVPLEGSDLSSGKIVDVIGIPEYVDDPATYAAYGLTEKGWYAFARVTSTNGDTVTNATTVTGAAGCIKTAGNPYIDVAVRFEVAAIAQKVVIHWGESTDTFIFRANDLAIRNLDYRTTFYVYDVAPFVTWTYDLTSDTTFVSGKQYYTEDNGVYTLAEVTADETVPENTYYVHTKAHFEGMTRNVSYRLNDLIDCPIEIVLPEIEDDGRGAWYDLQLHYDGAYSCTLLPPSGVSIGTVST